MYDQLPSTSSIAQALDIADAEHWTHQPPRSDHARLRFLLPRHPSITALAADLHTTPATVQNIIDHRQAAAAKPLHQAIANDIVRLWQPRVRARLHRQIVHGHGRLQVNFRAWFGFDAAGGSSDDGRERRLTETLPTPYSERLFEARSRDAGEAELRQILGDAIGEAYFNVSPMRGQSQVRLTDIAYVVFWY